MLVVVGVVEDLTKQPSSMEFSVNDATGRIRVRYYITGKQPKELEELVSGRYVSMFGNVRTAPTPHFVATGMRVVQSADEVSYHIIETAHAALKLQKGSGDSMGLSPKKQLHVAETSADVPMASPPKVVAESLPNATQLEGAALRSAIVTFLRQ